MVPGVARAIFLLSTLGSCGCAELLSHALDSVRTWLSTVLIPEQAEGEEGLIEASVARSALWIILI